MPDFSLEDECHGSVCGLDEVGRGPLAGPVIAACVFIPPDKRTLDFIEYIQDSKKLSKPKLLALHTQIKTHCVIGVGECAPAEIDQLNILWASLEAMKRAYNQACAAYGGAFDHALIDGNRLPPAFSCPANAIVKGDQKSKSIAAASIIAKVTRDARMSALAEDFPHYGWERNAAYPSPEHLRALEKHGVTPHHRRSFKPVKALL